VGVSLAGKAIVRSSASFGSSNTPLVLGRSLERLNCGRVAKGSFASKVLERASLAGEAIVRSSASFGTLDGPSVVGYSLQALATAGRSLATSPASTSSIRSFASCPSLDRPSAIGWSLRRLFKVS
jgi:predicted solute-binding protein